MLKKEKARGILKWIKNENPYINEEIIRKSLHLFKNQIPTFTTIIDRIYTTLYENPLVIGKESELYTEISVSRYVSLNRYLDIFLFIINKNKGKNNKYLTNPRTICVKVKAEGFIPSYIEFTTDLEPLRDFADILDELSNPETKLKIFDPDSDKDVVGYLSKMFDIGDMMWLRFKPTSPGRKVVYIMIDDEETKKTLKTIVCNVNIHRNIWDLLRNLVGGTTIPVSIIYILAHIFNISL